MNSYGNKDWMCLGNSWSTWRKNECWYSERRRWICGWCEDSLKKENLRLFSFCNESKFIIIYWISGSEAPVKEKGDY